MIDCRAAAICVGLLLQPLLAAACDDDSLPLRYLQTIQDMDWEAQAALLSANARYYDPTMTYYDRPAIDLTGPQDIVAFWRSASEESGTESIQYELGSCFETAGYYVIDYDIEIKVSGSFWNINKEVIVVPGQVSSIIRVEADAVSEHIDYVDYAGAERATDLLRERYGPATTSPE